MEKSMYEAVETINENVSNIHLHDTSDTEKHIQEELLKQYLDGDITEEEYMSKMSQTETKERLKGDVTEAKAQKYDELQQKFINDEISEEEMEERMDRLFESGEDFLEAEVSEGPDMTSKAAFRVKEIGQILAFTGIAGLAIYVFLMTKGAALLPMIVIGIIALLAYSRYKGAI